MQPMFKPIVRDFLHDLWPVDAGSGGGGGGGSQTSPADFTALTGTWIEGNKATPSTSTYAGGQITVEHVGNNQMTRWHTEVAAGDFDVGFKVRLTLNGNNFVGCGAFAGTSAGPHQRLENVGYLSKYGTNRFANQWWHASNNTFISEADIQTGISFPTDQVEYWRVMRIGTTIYWFRSLDAISWDFLFKQLDDGYMGGTADRVGVLLNTNGVPPGQVNSIVVEGFATDLSSTGIPAAPFETTAAGPYLVSTGAVVPAATSKITVSMLVTMNSTNASWQRGLFSFANASENFRVYADGWKKLNFDVLDDTGTDVMTSGVKTGAVITFDTPQLLTFSLDLANKLTLANITGGSVVNIQSYPVAANSGAMAMDLKFYSLRNPAGSMQLEGAAEYIKVWFGQATTDGYEPAATPDIEITGPAPVINPHPWKLGADAT